VIGVDAYSERYDYDRAGKLVAVYKMGAAQTCDSPYEIKGGTACEATGGSRVQCETLDADGGVADPNM
jgi:hypothetical protein